MTAQQNFTETHYSDGAADFRIIEGSFPWQRIIDDVNGRIVLVDLSQEGQPEIKLSPLQDIIVMGLEQNPQGLTNREIGALVERYGYKNTSATAQLSTLEVSMRAAFGRSLIHREVDPNYSRTSGRKPNLLFYRTDLALTP